jgi:hypothetical protein
LSFALWQGTHVFAKNGCTESWNSVVVCAVALAAKRRNIGSDQMFVMTVLEALAFFRRSEYVSGYSRNISWMGGNPESQQAAQKLVWQAEGLLHRLVDC